MQLDDSGKFDEAGCKTHLEKVYPEKYRADALTNLKECATNSCKGPNNSDHTFGNSFFFTRK